MCASNKCSYMYTCPHAGFHPLVVGGVEASLNILNKKEAYHENLNLSCIDLPDDL